MNTTPPVAEIIDESPMRDGSSPLALNSAANLAPRRVLIVRIGALGDGIHTLPLIHELKRLSPTTEVHWAAGPGILRFLDPHPGVEKFVRVDRGVRGFLAARARVKNNYDCVIDTQGLMKSALLAHGAAARHASVSHDTASRATARIIGRARGFARETPASWCYTDPVTPTGTHVIEQNLDLLAPLFPGYQRPTEISYDLAPGLPPAWPLLEQHPVLLNIGGGWWTKLWPAEKFAELARALDESLGLPVGIVWGPGEEAAAQRIAAMSPAQLAPPTTMRELAGAFARARLVVSGETGPLHLAVAVGCRTVALCGPTSAARNGAYGPGHIAVEAETLCRPCHARTCADWRCMPGISTARVVRAVADALG